MQFSLTRTCISVLQRAVFLGIQSSRGGGKVGRGVDQARTGLPGESSSIMRVFLAHCSHSILCTDTHKSATLAWTRATRSLLPVSRTLMRRTQPRVRSKTCKYLRLCVPVSSSALTDYALQRYHGKAHEPPDKPRGSPLADIRRSVVRQQRRRVEEHCR